MKHSVVNRNVLNKKSLNDKSEVKEEKNDTVSSHNVNVLLDNPEEKRRAVLPVQYPPVLAISQRPE
jgi:PhoPQ-activated pathogenicity-related protein